MKHKPEDLPINEEYYFLYSNLYISLLPSARDFLFVKSYC